MAPTPWQKRIPLTWVRIFMAIVSAQRLRFSQLGILAMVLLATGCGKDGSGGTAGNLSGLSNDESQESSVMRAITEEIRAADERIRHDNTSAAAYADRGQAYARRGDLAQAIEDLNEAVRLDPKLARAYAWRSLCFCRQGDLDQAERDADRTISLEPEKADGYFARATAHDAQSKPDLALADCNQALRLAPKLARAYYLRGLLHREGRDLDQALRDVDQAIQLDHDHEPSYRLRGVIHAQRRDLSRAIVDWDTAIRLDPKSAKALFLRGIVHAKQGDQDRAIDDLKQAEALGTLGQDLVRQLRLVLSIAYYGRGVRHGVANHLTESVSDLEESLRLNPEDAVVWHDLGITLGNKGEFRKAIQAFDRAISVQVDRSANEPDVAIRPARSLTADQLAETKRVRQLAVLSNSQASLDASPAERGGAWERSHQTRPSASSDESWRLSIIDDWSYRTQRPDGESPTRESWKAALIQGAVEAAPTLLECAVQILMSRRTGDSQKAAGNRHQGAKQKR